MIVDPKTGLTLEQVYNCISDIIEENMDSLRELKETIEKDLEVQDDVLDALEHKEELTPNDIRVLARAVGMDYELLTSDKLADDFKDRLFQSISALYAIRNKYKPEVQDGQQPAL